MRARSAGLRARPLSRPTCCAGSPSTGSAAGEEVAGRRRRIRKGVQAGPLVVGQAAPDVGALEVVLLLDELVMRWRSCASSASPGWTPRPSARSSSSGTRWPGPTARFGCSGGHRHGATAIDGQTGQRSVRSRGAGPREGQPLSRSGHQPLWAGADGLHDHRGVPVDQLHPAKDVEILVLPKGSGGFGSCASATSTTASVTPRPPARPPTCSATSTLFGRASAG
jgi:hypothetical protein